VFEAFLTYAWPTLYAHPGGFFLFASWPLFSYMPALGRSAPVVLAAVPWLTFLFFAVCSFFCFLVRFFIPFSACRLSLCLFTFRAFSHWVAVSI
jgi:hypothetical protein